MIIIENNFLKIINGNQIEILNYFIQQIGCACQKLIIDVKLIVLNHITYFIVMKSRFTSAHCIYVFDNYVFLYVKAYTLIVPTLFINVNL